MIDFSEAWERLATGDGGRIVFLVVDGLGGIAAPGCGTELQQATTPQFDALAQRSSCGLFEPVGPGISPGSGPGHMALLGYDPLRYVIGRGVFAALGAGFDLREGDLAARMNFATLDDAGNVADRRAGARAGAFDDARCADLCARLEREVRLDAGMLRPGPAESRDELDEAIDGVELHVVPGRGHRAALVLRGANLWGEIDDTDPLRAGVPPRAPRPFIGDAAGTAALVQSFVAQSRELLAGEPDANAVLLRGFQRYAPVPSFDQRFKVRGACLATDPLVRGLARLIGLELSDAAPGDAASLMGLPSAWTGPHDFFLVHMKQADARAEEGDFAGKVRFLEELDHLLPEVASLEPDVLLVTGDHSTPAAMGRHSWHPVPVLLAARDARIDDVDRFDEIACARGALGLRPSLHAMGLALAHAGRLRRFGP